MEKQDEIDDLRARLEKLEATGGHSDRPGATGPGCANHEAFPGEHRANAPVYGVPRAAVAAAIGVWMDDSGKPEDRARGLHDGLANLLIAIAENNGYCDVADMMHRIPGEGEQAEPIRWGEDVPRTERAEAERVCAEGPSAAERPMSGSESVANAAAILHAFAIPEFDLSIGVVGLRCLTREIHRRNREAGWWTNLETGEPLKRNVGEMLMLVVTELAEAMEGHRKSKMDDHLPHRPMIEVELADVLVRVFDIAGGLDLDLAGAFAEKVAYNAERADHKLEARRQPGGKAC